MMTEGQLERINPSTCEQCGTSFEAKNRNGVVKRFCSRACKTVWHNLERLRLYKERARTRQRGPSKRARQVSRFVFLSLVPVEQRAELLRQAAQNLGITDEGEVVKALRRNGCARPSAASLQPSEATA